MILLDHLFDDDDITIYQVHDHLFDDDDITISIIMDPV